MYGWTVHHHLEAVLVQTHTVQQLGKLAQDGETQKLNSSL